jgi:hypothetical protein
MSSIATIHSSRKPSTTLLASAVTEWIGAVVALWTAGFATFAATQVWDIKRQTRQSALANISQSYAHVSVAMAAFRKSLFEHPEWIPYFYEGRDPAEDEPQRDLDLGKLDLMCDEILDLADAIIEQRNTVPDAEMDWSTWDSYLRFLYQRSPLLQRYLRGSIDFYPDYVLTVFGYIVVRHEQSGEVLSEWSVGEWGGERPEGPDRDWPDREWLERNVDAKPADDASRPGYPWFRTWVITKIAKNDDDEPVTLIAAARPGPDAQTARVSLAWYEPPGARDPALKPVLCSWVLVTLQGSCLLEQAEVRFETERETVQLRKRLAWHKRLLRERLPRERYLAPRLPSF